MAFQPSRIPKRSKNEMVVSIGARAYVNWTQPPGEPRRGVPMVDGSGTLLANDLSDGEEVEIVSWRPRSREGLSYQIRRMRDGSEWWIAAIYLRRLAAAGSAAAPAAHDEKGGQP
jgi:hypothetical protein